MNSESCEDIGIVKSITGKTITVQIEKGGGCHSCGMKNLCGSNNKPIILHFTTEDTFQVGDKVIVSITSGMRIMASLIVFIFPLILLFGFYAIARYLLHFSEGLSISMAMVGLLNALFICKMLDKLFRKKINFSLGGKYEDLP